jgi:hypothetical protein
MGRRKKRKPERARQKPKWKLSRNRMPVLRNQLLKYQLPQKRMFKPSKPLKHL